MIRTEYLNFLQTLGEDPTLASVRKVANLVLNNLNVLIPLTTTSGQRIRKIVDLGQSSWSNANSDISVITSTQTDIHPKLTRLKKLTVGVNLSIES